MIGANEHFAEHERFLLNKKALFFYSEFLFLKTHSHPKNDILLPAPRIALIPICPRHLEYAHQLKKALEEKLNTSVMIYMPHLALSERIKAANKQNITFHITLGDREAEAQLLAVRKKHEGARVDYVSLSGFMELFRNETKRTQF